MRILFVATSHDEMGNTGKKTGVWLEEIAVPYYIFKNAGFELDNRFSKRRRGSS
jgi:putative intracellular protease/amidase